MVTQRSPKASFWVQVLVPLLTPEDTARCGGVFHNWQKINAAFIRSNSCQPTKPIGEEEQTGRRRRSLLTRNRPEEDEPKKTKCGRRRRRSQRHGWQRTGDPQPPPLEEEEETSNVVTRTFGSLREYFEGVRSELDKVVWPTREETQRLTIIVLITLIASSLVLGAISLFFTELFRIGLGSPIILLVVMVASLIGGFVFFRVHQPTASY